jgi:cytochrome c oxidase assembly protein subunit 15
MAVVVGLQLRAGVLLITLGVPLWMQVVHLALADLLWITYVLVTVRLLAPATSALSPAATAVPPRT